MKITIVGTGYVGLVTGTCLAEVGHHVICVDVDQKKIDNLKKGIIPIYEPGLEELVLRNSKEGRLEFTTNIKSGIEHGDVVFNAVGTPPGENHEADLKYVKQVARDFGKHWDRYKVFVIKSTVPVGTSDEVTQEILENCPDNAEFDVVSNPEFLREGTALKDFMNPDRIIAGLNYERGEAERARKVIEKVYEPLMRVGKPLIFTDIRSSEIIKYASNAFLATKISFINEIANFCDRVGGDAKQIARGMGLDDRIGPRFLHAGVGYGGSCFPKDVKALIQSGKKANYDFSILEAVEHVNQTQRGRLFDKIKKSLEDLNGKTIAVWGLSFKPKTDDMREAPSIDVIRSMCVEGATIRAFDPVAMEHADQIFAPLPVEYFENPYETCEGADALVIMTEWDAFRAVDFEKLSSLMNGRAIIDGRNIYERADVEEAGFTYDCFGR